MDAVITVKADPLTDRALNIFCAHKNKSKKEVVASALETFIPEQFFNIAKKEIGRGEAADE